MAGGDEILRFCIVGDGIENRFRAIGRGNTGGDFRRRINGYRKAVPKGDVFSETIIESCRCFTRSSVNGRQMSPRPWVAMKLMA